MWNTLWVVLVVLAVCAFFGYMRRWNSSRKRPKDMFVCSECNEHHCNCSRED